MSNLLGPRTVPAATLSVNVAGSFALGLLVAWGATRLSPEVLSALAVGFLGAFTTFSTFTFDAVTLGRDGRAGVAVVYVLASVGLGLLAAAAGHEAGRRILG